MSFVSFLRSSVRVCEVCMCVPIRATLSLSVAFCSARWCFFFVVIVMFLSRNNSEATKQDLFNHLVRNDRPIFNTFTFFVVAARNKIESVFVEVYFLLLLLGSSATHDTHARSRYLSIRKWGRKSLVKKKLKPNLVYMTIVNNISSTSNEANRPKENI